MKKKRLAIVLLNMGGPDCPESVKPFLFNLFNDPAIIPLPALMRRLLAWFISSRRAPVARDIYDKIGGGSPLLELTRDQAKALEKEFQDEGEIKVFIAMRYWHPMSDETVGKVKVFAPDEIILLPLYPQYSKATSGSSIAAWKQAAVNGKLKAATYTVCCYPTQPGLIREHGAHIRNALAKADKCGGRTRILFSAHGLPKKNIEDGDPYAWQVERTAKAVIAEMNIETPDWAVCYQSRVGRQAWIEPYIQDELERAANDKVAVVIVPIAFVSEHSETLVELDIQYRELADKLGIPGFFRTPAIGTGGEFIEGLADVVRMTRDKKMEYGSSSEEQHCPVSCRHCPNHG